MAPATAVLWRIADQASFDELPLRGDAAANIPPTQVTADGAGPGGHMHGIGFRWRRDA